MSEFVWSKLVLLLQLDLISLIGWSVVSVFSVSIAGSYLRALAVPAPLSRRGAVDWVPLPVDLTALPSASILSQAELGDLGPMFEGGDGEGNIWGGYGNNGDGLPGGAYRIDGAEDDPSPGDQPVEQMPELVTIPEPDYPPMARAAQIEGVVRLQVLVGRDGRVNKTRIETSIPMLDDSARSAARGARFKPAMWRREPVAVWVTLPIRFELDD